MNPLSAGMTKLLAPLLNNLYWVHLDIVEVCAKWVPRRTAGDERIWLATQLKRETAEIPMYQGLLERLGIKPDPAMRIRDSLLRYRALKETEDEIDMVVGMNVVAQGTLGIIEHEQLSKFAPGLLDPFAEAAIGMRTDLDRAVLWLQKRDQAAVTEAFRRYWIHLHEISLPELTPLLEPLIKAGVFAPDLISDARRRFAEIMRRSRLEPSCLKDYSPREAGHDRVPSLG